MTFDKASNKLTLTGVSPVTVFLTIRPARIDGNMKTAAFIPLWAEGRDSLKSDPPNADISMLKGKTQTQIVDELQDPVLTGDNLHDQEFEKRELANIYVSRGVEHGLARQVAEQLKVKDALGAHARDELGISEITTAHPVQAALTSAATFSIGAAAPLAIALVSPSRWIIAAVSIGSLVFLAVLGTIGARAGGANIVKPTIRVTFWGALAMGVTAGIGAIFGTVG
jgi:VIT1/CCC1 family predicted Fe2+/Mn2+ transporter